MLTWHHVVDTPVEEGVELVREGLELDHFGNCSDSLRSTELLGVG